jgi:phosphoesterase RecJ-like protein
MIDAHKPEQSLPPAKPLSADLFLSLIKKSKRVLALAGRPIDGDSLASAIAFRRMVRDLGVDCDIACGESVPQQLHFLPDSEQVLFDPDFLSYDLIAIFDCGELRQTGFVEQLLKLLKSKDLAKVVNVDHHMQEPVYGHYSVLDREAASTGLVVYRLLNAWGLSMDEPTATALLSTLYHDTGSFQHSNTNPDALRMAAECVRNGADAAYVAGKLYRNKSDKVLRLWGRALQRLEYRPENRMVVSIITLADLKELGVEAEEAKGIVNVLSQVPECRFALLLTEEEGEVVKGSLRSDEGKDTDVARIARILGGGGHRLASGFRLNGRLVQQEGRYKVV